MPLVHIALREGKPEAYRQAIFDNVYRALHETYEVPEDDQFMSMVECSASNFRYSKQFLGVSRTDDVVFIQMTVSNTRTLDRKRELYRRLTELLGENPGLRPGDVFINLIEVARENWSMGNGIASYV